MKFCGDETWEGGFLWLGSPLREVRETDGKNSSPVEERAIRILRARAFGAELAAAMDKQRKDIRQSAGWFTTTGTTSAVINPVWTNQFVTNSPGFGGVTIFPHPVPLAK